MTNPTALAALAERVERNTGPDNTLWLDIAKALGWTRGNPQSVHWSTPDGEYHRYLPCWLTSIDAALTLTDWILITLSDIAGDGMPFARFADSDGREAIGCARTKALAVVAAALRARSLER